MFFHEFNQFFLKNYFSFFFSFLSSSKTMNLCSKCFAGMFSFFCALMCFECTSRWDWVLVETDFFSLPKFPPGTLLALTALCHGSWSWSILDSVCISAWQHGGTIKLCPWSSSVLLYGENYTRMLFLTQATPKLHQAGTSDANCIVNLVNFF